MTQSNSSSDYLTGLFLAILIIVGGFFIFLSPFTVSNYEDNGKNYIFRTYFFGHWSLEEDGELLNEGGISQLDNFPVYSSVIVFIGLIGSYISLFFLLFYQSREHQYFNIHRRISGVSVILVNIIGLIGTLLQIPYVRYLDSIYGTTQYYYGFVVAVIFFSLFMIVGIPAVVKPDHFTKIRKKKREITETDVNT